MAEEEAGHGHPSRYVQLTRDQDAPADEDIRPGELNQPVPFPQVSRHFLTRSRSSFFSGASGCWPDLTGSRRWFACAVAGAEEVLRVRAGAARELRGAGGRAVDHRHLRMRRGRRELYVSLAFLPRTFRSALEMSDSNPGWTGLFCPCVLFGHNVEALREDIPWTTPCTCHAVCVEGGIALAILTVIFPGIDPSTSILIGEGLVFSWWLFATYTGIFRQQLQRKYHLKNSPCDPCLVHCCLHWCANCQEHRERKGRLADNNADRITIVNPPPMQEMSVVGNRPSITPENGAA